MSDLPASGKADAIPSTSALLQRQLREAGYLPDHGLATSLWLAQGLQRPLLIEGDAGVGKTALALALARSQNLQLIRLQCYEGLDLNQAAYEWNYAKQLLAIRLSEAQHTHLAASDMFSRDYLLERPLLAALGTEQPCVLLIDEIDRADEGFEAFLLEVLSDYQISVPELGTVKAKHVPWVILTSNGTRELSDALRRRCLYHYLDYPSLPQEIAIVKLSLPEVDTHLVEEAVAIVQRLRKQELAKNPGVAETLDWVKALHRIHPSALDADVEVLLSTLGCLLKTKEDRFQFDAVRLQQVMHGGGPQGVAVPKKP